MKKKKLILLCIVAVMAFSVPVIAAIPHVGAERSFSSDLPNEYGNAYFPTRTKQSNYAVGYVYLTSKPRKCDGICAWICNDAMSRCSSISHVNSLNVETPINYTSNYAIGSKVRLGIEDEDNTLLGHHSVSGVVNYN